MSYEEMSDFEINKLVAGIFLPCDHLFDDESKRVELANYQDVMIGDMVDQVLTPYQEFNPCNNPSDAWLIILKYGISINFDGIDWEADTSWMGSGSSNRSYNNIEKNAGKPLRAAMICFLKMKDAENE